MSERKLYQDLKSIWKFYMKKMPDADGIPDCHLVNGNKQDIYLELKKMDRKFRECLLPIKKTQFIWHAEYSGKNAYMLFQVGDRYYLFKKSNVMKLRGKITWSAFLDACTIDAESLLVIARFLEDC